MQQAQQLGSRAVSQQKLILPINQAKLTASWKTDAYLHRFGYAHYGVDMVSREGRRTVYASGIGEVVAAGYDNMVGNVAAVRYFSALSHADASARDIVFRYFHLGRIDVREGQRVDKDTVLGLYGNTGQMQMAFHLHLEADLDVAHPLYSPTVLRSDYLRGRALGAHDATMRNPLHLLYVKPTPPDLQSFQTAQDIYIRKDDRYLPDLS